MGSSLEPPERNASCQCFDFSSVRPVRDFKLQIIMYVFFVLFFLSLFIYFWLRWVFIAARGLSLRVSHRGGLSRCGAWALGARGSVVVAHGLSCSAARGILLDQGSNLCPLHWQADS